MILLCFYLCGLLCEGDEAIHPIDDDGRWLFFFHAGGKGRVRYNGIVAVIRRRRGVGVGVLD